MRVPQLALLSLVERIFADGVVTPAERSELVLLYREGGLTVAEVREVFKAFMAQSWGEAIADGVLTDEERKKLSTIVRELHIPRDCVPDTVKWLVAA
jgi:tellurite resistance protein